MITLSDLGKPVVPLQIQKVNAITQPLSLLEADLTREVFLILFAMISLFCKWHTAADNFSDSPSYDDADVCETLLRNKDPQFEFFWQSPWFWERRPGSSPVLHQLYKCTNTHFFILFFFTIVFGWKSLWEAHT